MIEDFFKQLDELGFIRLRIQPGTKQPAGIDGKGYNWQGITENQVPIEEAINSPGGTIGFNPHGQGFIVDLDVKNGENGIQNWQTVLDALNYQALNDTATDITKSGGKHLFFKLVGYKPGQNFNKKYNKKDNKPGLGIEIRQFNLQCVFWNNLSSYDIYEITVEQLIKIIAASDKLEKSIADATADLQNNSCTGFENITADMLPGKTAKFRQMNDTEIIQYCADLKNGSRHPVLKDIACAQVWHTVKTDQQIYEFLLKCNTAFPDPLSEKELKKYILRKKTGVLAWAHAHSKKITSAAAMFEERHRNFCKVEVPFSIWNPEVRDLQPRLEWQKHREQTAGNKIILDDGNIISLAKEWLYNSPNAATGVCYRPDLEPNSIVEIQEYGLKLKKVNLFSGFIKPAKEGSCQLFLDYVRDIIARGNSKYYEWLIQWMARIIQKPADTIHRYALALSGVQGIGKGFFFESFGRLLGDNFISIGISTNAAFSAPVEDSDRRYVCFEPSPKKQPRLFSRNIRPA